VFTVEVKRRRPKSPHASMTAEGHLHERLRREGLLTSFRHEPPAQAPVDWGDLIKSSPSQESMPSSPETTAAGPSGKLRTGRILPDVLGARLAAERIQQEKVNVDGRQRQPRVETPQVAKHIRLSRDARIAGISPVPSAEMSEQPRANVRPAESGGTASTIMPAGNRIEVGEHHCEKAKDKRVLNGAQRRAQRRGLPTPLRCGERWKRRLPEVCW
jgi:hypothetical protein